MRALLAVALLVCGCRQILGLETPVERDATPAPDSGGDGACTSFSSLLDTCTLPAGGPVVLSGNATLDTGTGALSPPVSTQVTTVEVVTTGGQTVRVLVASDFSVNPTATLRALGPEPLVIVATANVQLDGALDVGAGGAGARATCITAGQVGQDEAGGAGGGGGAGFGAAGGAGGQGNSDGSHGLGGMGGAASAVPMDLVGGCPGGKGGTGTDPGGAGGLGGGAVYLVARGQIVEGVSGEILAGGGGGDGGHVVGIDIGDAGGGGGGSGGLIELEAPTVQCRGVLAANGGGGGEGSGSATTGNAGQAGLASTMQASGGSGGSATGSDGARGGARQQPGGGAVTTIDQGGGGGGGGGVGFVIVRSPSVTTATASPSVTML